MNSDYSHPIDFWREIFKEFQQVEHVNSVFDADRLDIKVKGREETLQATEEELDDSLHKFHGNPHEVVSYFLRKHGVLVYYQDTLVGFLDIQAYSNYISSTSMEEAIRSVSKFFSGTSSVARTDFLAVKFDHWILSDSIILVVDTSRHPLFAGSLEYFMGTCSYFMMSAMMQGLPLRGAIGGGDFYKDGEILVSTGLVDAALYEKEQEWLGAVLTPSAIKLVEKAKEFERKIKGNTQIDFFSDKFRPYLRYGTIPWKRAGRPLEKHDQSFYIKPFGMADKNWATKYLPRYFDDALKIENSHCLYAEA
jgi:hypothetical protein